MYPDTFAAARYIWDHTSGVYDFRLYTQEETDGESTYRILINGQLVGEPFQNERGDDVGRVTYYDIALTQGDTIQIESNTHSNETVPEEGSINGYGWSRGRWLKIRLYPKETGIYKLVRARTACSLDRTNRAYDCRGRMVRENRPLFLGKSRAAAHVIVMPGKRLLYRAQ